MTEPDEMKRILLSLNTCHQCGEVTMHLHSYLCEHCDFVYGDLEEEDILQDLERSNTV